MTIQILFFAGLRESFGCSRENLQLQPELTNVGDLRDHIAKRGEPWAALSATKNLRAAVNHQMVPMDAPIKDGDEIAFFPPVTGG
jgi:molybdopterin synthase sulfur carrier subunit